MSAPPVTVAPEGAPTGRTADGVTGHRAGLERTENHVATHLVTGGTGLIGSNVCRLLVERGDTVRALVRPGSEPGPLAALGIEIVEGDIQSGEDFTRAAEGCDTIINSAALLGGAAQNIEEQKRTNVAGSHHAYDAGAAHGIRVTTLSSTPFLDHRTHAHRGVTGRRDLERRPVHPDQGCVVRGGEAAGGRGGRHQHRHPGRHVRARPGAVPRHAGHLATTG